MNLAEFDSIEQTEKLICKSIRFGLVRAFGPTLVQVPTLILQGILLGGLLLQQY